MRYSKQATFLMLSFVAFLLVGAGQVFAAPVTFSANTSGTFGAGNTGGTVTNNGATLIIGGTIIAFSSKPNEINVSLNPGESSNVTLGVFNATSTTASTVNGATFTLNVTFTLPVDVSPKPATYNATLTGTINSGASGASVVWSTTTLTFNSPTAGTFTLTLEPSTPINSPISPDASRIRGTIVFNSAAVPEPATLLLLGSGLAGLGALVRRRTKK